MPREPRALIPVSTFWARSASPTRWALAVAVIALILNVSSYFGLGMDRPFALYGTIHVSLMLLGVWLLVQIARHHVAGLRGTPGSEPVPSYPPLLWWALVLSVPYAAINLAIIAAGGEGGPATLDGQPVWMIGQRTVRTLSAEEYRQAQMSQLRAFSAVWLAFALATAAGHDRLLARIQRFSVTRPGDA